MNRKLYLTSYDIRDPRRLQKVHRFCKERGLALQYSVFVMEGTDADRGSLAAGLEELIDPDEDDVRIYTLPQGVEVVPMGKASPLPPGVVLVGVGGAGRLLVPDEARAE
ncbi:CRISPR-associated endonuclease Cas2 [Deferrisoma camini]|uniref:CRISPR-associated endonuclease Cas2 n=1 Tax=Deferrisoma camini TaxID=1035120 RepID=UPI00046CDA0A|nr:CRISPR-associated endonuclease Cas2 [Deferrisoma camini]